MEKLDFHSFPRRIFGCKTGFKSTAPPAPPRASDSQQSPNFLTDKEPGNRFQGINSCEPMKADGPVRQIYSCSVPSPQRLFKFQKVQKSPSINGKRKDSRIRPSVKHKKVKNKGPSGRNFTGPVRQLLQHKFQSSKQLARSVHQ